MSLASIFEDFAPELEAAHGHKLLPSHRRAIKAIIECRTPDAGQIIVHCPTCNRFERRSHSCGHRSCPRCQNHENSTWLARQMEKLLPVQYFLVTFTISPHLRKLAWHHQRVFFSCMFEAAAAALRKALGVKRFLGGKIGMTGVLHTASRTLAFHPHLHFVVPAGAIDVSSRTWRRNDGEFLVPQPILARLFRGSLLDLLHKHGLSTPDVGRADWVVDCESVGSGAGALKYLARYLYRGVVSEKQISRTPDGNIALRYRESNTGLWRRLILAPADFLWLVLQHVLPRGFRRARDYGFLHGHSVATLRLLQLLLHAKTPEPLPVSRPPFLCKLCGGPMNIIACRQRPATRAPP